MEARLLSFRNQLFVITPLDTNRSARLTTTLADAYHAENHGEDRAKRKNVDLSAIQMHEQRNKGINHAQAVTLYQLSQVMGCGMEDLLESGGHSLSYRHDD